MLTANGPVESLEGFFRASYTMAARHPKVTAALLGAGRRIPRSLHDEYVPIVDTILTQIRALVDAGIASGDFVAADPHALSQALTDLLAGGVEDIVSKESCVPTDVVIETRLALLRGGILTRSAVH